MFLFTGSPRYYHEKTQDAMTYVRQYGRPDLFVTFTCNPGWIEIKQELLDGQAAHDRHDVVARVFKLKLNKMMDLFLKQSVFGKCRCHMLSIEWQKRGLPHAHILLWLEETIRLSDVDKIISAEIPCKQTDPDLFDVVMKNMVHGPCGILNRNSPCMKDGICTKKFPKQFTQVTKMSKDGYPLYQRKSPEDGGVEEVIKKGNEELVINNSWVVPYCPLLSKTFKAHINVELCSSVKSIKYICKYVNKGSDACIFDLENPGKFDEVKQYQLGRYISSNEAVWRLLGFNIHERFPPVQHLSVHLEGDQRVFFQDGEENLAQRLQEAPKTTLTSFFELCSTDNFAKTLLYVEVPKYYTWSPSTKKFKRRVRGTQVDGLSDVKGCSTLGRVYTVHPNNRECFYLRLLLHEVRGPTSYQHLKTVNGQICSTFQEACMHLGLLQSDEHWKKTLDEAAATQSPRKLRDLFAVMLSSCELNCPLELWNKNKENLSEDFLYAVSTYIH